MMVKKVKKKKIMREVDEKLSIKELGPKELLPCFECPTGHVVSASSLFTSRQSLAVMILGYKLGLFIDNEIIHAERELLLPSPHHFQRHFSSNHTCRVSYRGRGTLIPPQKL